MFVWAEKLLATVPTVMSVLRERFPILFVDEAQDNGEEQALILHRIFMNGAAPVIRQRFGDANQAIFNFVGQTGATKDLFPDDCVKKDLPNSHRFGQKIADIADPLGFCPCGLVGQGPKKLLVSGVMETPHTLFLFADDQIGSVLDAYADVLIETFSDQELREGSFIAVGQVHRDCGDDHFPRHVGHYWPEYDPELSTADPTPQFFVQYVFAGQGSAAAVGETSRAVEKIAQGLMRLGAMVKEAASLRICRNDHRYVLELLESNAQLLSCYKILLSRFALQKKVLTRGVWNSRWRMAVRRIGEALGNGSLTNPEADAFLSWPDHPDTPLTTPIAQSGRDNLYRCSRNDKQVVIRVGSIHSVKGETHTAACVLETFWHVHNLESIKAWLLGEQSGSGRNAVRIQNRLKLHYVAMTRPTHLLCLAMKQSTFAAADGTIDGEAMEKLAARGWIVRQL